MHIIPAVDIRNGKAVRLFQGRKDRETVYGDSPVAMARRWADAGATWLHVVDLDGAFEGESANEAHIREITASLDIPVQVGGGVRSVEKAARLLDAGVARVIVGTGALEDRRFLDELLAAFARKVCVGVDVRDGFVAVKGWTETSAVKAEDFLQTLPATEVAAVIYTDISRDGALQGVNVEAMRRATEVTAIPIIASGGVTGVADIKALAKLPLFGIITGTALYDGRLTLPEAMAALREGNEARDQ